MKLAKPAMMLVCLIGLSACSNGGIFGNKTADTAATAALNAGEGLADGAISESTLAFFNSTVGDRVQFLVDQSTLTPDAVAILDAQAEWLIKFPTYSAIVEGHADEQGTRDYNIALGDRRATTVFNYLISRGVPGTRLTTVSFGKERPLEVCSEESCWSRNRRAVTVVAGGFVS